jgi:AcrR family transcriptional regulator
MSRGRPREFDTNCALDKAMVVFWRRGYRVTSLDDLTSIMKITKPSLYAAFGDKEHLFLMVLDRYAKSYGGRVVGMLETDSDVQRAIKAFLDAVIEQLSDPNLPTGCLRINSTLECRGLSDAIDRKLIEYQGYFDSALYERLRRAQIEEQIPIQEDIQALARFFASVVNGMSVQARVNANSIMLQQIANTAMRILPVQIPCCPWQSE